MKALEKLRCGISSDSQRYIIEGVGGNKEDPLYLNRW